MKCSLVCLLGMGFLFSGCTDTYTISQNISGSDVAGNSLEQMVEEQREKSAFLVLRKAEQDIYALELHNPKQEKVQAVKASFTYPAHLAKINGALTDTKIFPLHISSDNDAEKGMVTLEIAQDGKAEIVDEKKVIYAFEMEKVSSTPFQLEIGNMEIMMIDENGNLVNIANDELVEVLVVE